MSDFFADAMPAHLKQRLADIAEELSELYPDTSVRLTITVEDIDEDMMRAADAADTIVSEYLERMARDGRPN